jgi:transposase-like protein
MGRKFSSEVKDQVLKDVRETGEVATVARQYGISPYTIQNWIRMEKGRGQMDQLNELRALKKQLKDLDLENRVLKSLLKKTYPHWESAEKL